MTEIEERLLRDAFDALNPMKSGSSDEAQKAQQARERIGEYLKYQEQRKPVAYVAAGVEDGIWIVLAQYAGRNESEVYSRVLAQAMKEGYRGTGVDRMRELGWEIKGLYLD
ncbi:hypothetical protein SAMN05216466_10746 [Paraburkholderia phenazinium]|uniref:Uncharacterized protein n=1 Tax=Paraburkholderia phenazinium TaxID=60549 RepID=A0A1G7ZKA8_9BURK|nr:hypothetical protein [Paraburkholderia phenazinium]SDH08540.1 hypothetical protein SAMN05216466_10746 [Paraburkholderia phenazinium]